MYSGVPMMEPAIVIDFVGPGAQWVVTVMPGPAGAIGPAGLGILAGPSGDAAA